MSASKDLSRIKEDHQDNPEPPPVSGGAFFVVGIGASAGGLEAVSELLKSLPSDSGMAFIFVQHLAPDHRSALAEILSKKTAMQVIEATDGRLVEPNHVYVIAPNTIMTIVRGYLELKPRNDALGHPMPIDDLFHALAEDQGSNAIGISLSGTGTDGALGMQAIKSEGGITFAQDEMSAQYGGMPRAAVGLGCVDFVLAPKEIAEELIRISRHPLLGDLSTPGLERLEASEVNLKRIFRLLQNTCNLDFTHYKRGTIKRRLARRLALQNLSSVPDYINFLNANPDEAKSLCQDFLIHVTSFFRDPDTFESLVQYVFPRLIEGPSPKNPLRIWVPGCSTGEEVYSIAISCLEYLGKHGIGTQIQIFGTDISEEALRRARAGIYVENIARNVSPERLEKFFVKTGAHYQIAKSVRDLCIFACHNVTRDPPFSRLDLISCRNLLIYLDPLLQKRVIPLFHYALKPEGILILGPAENISGFTDIFTLTDNKKIKLYTKQLLPARSQLRYLEDYAGKSPSASPPPSSHSVRKNHMEVEPQKRLADRITLGRYVPAAVLCDKSLNILEFRGDTSLYLNQPAGSPDINLQKLAKPGLLVEISKAIQKAAKDGATVRKSGLQVETAAGNREISLEVVPVQQSVAEEPQFLIFFEDPSQFGLTMAKGSRFWDVLGKLNFLGLKSGRRNAQQANRDDEISRLKRELSDTRDHIRTMMEEYEVTKEELLASQEELLSSNEEFQSTNEELETAKEELQSANEELLTTNEEMGHRNTELNHVNTDLTNLQASTRLAVVLLGRDLTIRQFSPLAGQQLNLLITDLGRPIGTIRHNILLETDRPGDLEGVIAGVINDTREAEREVRDKEGNYYSMRVRPYMTLDNKVSGAVLVLIDINALKQTEVAQGILAAIVSSSNDAILSKTLDGSITTWNAGAERMFGYTAEEMIGQSILRLIPPELRDEEDQILGKVKAGEPIEHYETVRVTKDAHRITVSLTISPIKDATGKIIGASKIARDISERKHMAEKLAIASNEAHDRNRILQELNNQLKDNDQHKDEFLAMLAHELRNPLVPIRNALEIWRRSDIEEKMREELQSIMDRQLQKVVKIVDDLLDVSRITRGVILLNKEITDLGLIISHTVDS